MANPDAIEPDARVERQRREVVAGATALTLTAGVAAALARRPESTAGPLQTREPATVDPGGLTGDVPAVTGDDPAGTGASTTTTGGEPGGPAAAAGPAPNATPEPGPGRSTGAPALTAAERRLHVVQRITYGATPALLAEVEAQGVERYVAQQLDPATVDDSRADAMVRSLSTLRGSAADLDDAENGLLGLRPKGQALHELRLAALIRAVHSRRQLFEVMVAFWSDHLNVWPHKDRELPYEKLVEDREVIRPHALGRYADLLQASAASPAMLRYLDNRSSRRQHPNENYARELLELHTVGPDTHSEDDVMAAARVFTGWTIDDRHRFRFDPQRHDDGPAEVLGWSTPGRSTGGAVGDGRSLLDHLAHHPATARTIATKLARRFVADDPPASLIDALARTYLANDTQIRPVLAHLLSSDEFLAARRGKYRRPFEFVAALLRTLDAGIDTSDPATARAVNHWLRSLGQLPFDWPSPDGYPDESGSWLSGGDVVGRWSTASVVSQGRLGGITVDLDRLVHPDAASTAAELADRVVSLLPDATAGLRDTLLLAADVDAGAAADEVVRRSLPVMVAVAVASKGMQWR